MRAETGPMRIGDDWCGVFIRGDNALMRYLPSLLMAVQNLRALEGNCFDALQIAMLEDLIKLLRSCAEPIPPEQQKYVQSATLRVPDDAGRE